MGEGVDAKKRQMCGLLWQPPSSPGSVLYLEKVKEHQFLLDPDSLTDLEGWGESMAPESVTEHPA